MSVERIKKINIDNQTLITGLYGQTSSELFLEDNLTPYSLRPELCNYLHDEGYVVVFYNHSFNFFSYRESDLVVFFNKSGDSPEENTSVKIHAKCRGPLGQCHRRIKPKSDNQNLGIDAERRTDGGLVIHYKDFIQCGMGTELFYGTRKTMRPIDDIIAAVNANPGRKICVVFTDAENTEPAIRSVGIPQLAQLMHDFERAEIKLRILLLYNASKLEDLIESFEKERDKFFYDKFFRNLFGLRQTEDEEIHFSDRSLRTPLVNIGRPERDEIASVLNRRRIVNGMGHTFDVQFETAVHQIWQQFEIKVGKGKKKCEIKEIHEMLNMEMLPNELFEEHLSRMSSESAREQLGAMVGVSSLIEQLDRYLADYRASQDTGEVFPRHMVFLGNPGTGKTTVARLFADLLREEGLLRTGRLHQVTVGDLVSSIVGGTRPKTMAVCREASGGVLFIDEAYGLYRSGRADSGDDNSQAFGREAVEVLIQFMLNDHDSLVIMAGYTEEMEDMLAHSNTGLKSRIGNQGIFMFEDYKPEDLTQIALRQLHCETTGVFRQSLKAVFSQLYRLRDKTWGNARTAENVASQIRSWRRSQGIEGICGSESIPPQLMNYIRPISEEDTDAIMSKLNRLIGLRKVKESLENIRRKVDQDRRDMSKYGNTEADMPNLSFLFVGNPGTGKTTVAGLLGEILYGFGLLSSPKVVTYHQSDLVSGIHGGSAKLVDEAFENCIGKVLFIDEAASLAQDPQLVKQIVGNMTSPKYKGKLAFVMASYRGEMNDLMKVDGGFKGRFREEVVFEDYTASELFTILREMAEREGFFIDEGSEKYAKAFFEEHRGDNEYSNARGAEKLLVQLKEGRSRRLDGRRRAGLADDEERRTIVPEDFPNYGNASVKDLPPEETVLTPWQKLERMKGMDSLLVQFRKFLNLLRYDRDNPGKIKVRRHMAFMGNPGTGKTTVARYFAEVMIEEGLLDNTNFIETSSGGLIAGCLGQSAEKAMRVFESSRGGVLFIDEAYQLWDKQHAKGSGGGQYNQEVITELIRFMENDKSSMVVLAGYTDEMRFMFEANAGWDSRIPKSNHYYFDDYSPEVLFDILLSKIPFDSTPRFRSALRDIVENMYNRRDLKKWGNAREMENLAQSIEQQYIDKVMEDPKALLDVDCLPVIIEN